MERRTLGRTGLEVSALGFGAAEIGFLETPQADIDRLLNSALDAGLNVLDTAECYGDSEEMIDRAIGHRRGEYFLFTKCGHASGLPYADWSPELITASIDRSLKRLKTDCVDLVQLHSCNGDILRQGDVISALQKARDAGKTRFIGYSGDNAAAQFAVESGAFDTLQISVSLADQQSITRVLPLAAERNLGVIAKRPIAGAVWMQEYSPDKEYAEWLRFESYWHRLKALDYDCLKADAPDAAVSAALRFTLAQLGVTTAIVGTTNPERWIKNARLLDDGPLPDAQIKAIRARWEEVSAPDWVGQL